MARMHGLCGSKWDLKPDLNRCHRHETWTSSLLCHKCSLSCWLAACFVFSKWSVKRATITITTRTWLQKDVYGGSNYRYFDKKGFLKHWWSHEDLGPWNFCITSLNCSHIYPLKGYSSIGGNGSISPIRMATWCEVDRYNFLYFFRYKCDKMPIFDWNYFGKIELSNTWNLTLSFCICWTFVPKILIWKV